MQTYATFHDLKGKSVFITGGGSGIGAALTEGFLAQGAKVAFVQRSDATDFAADMGEKYGRRPLFIPCDITDIDALKSAMAQSAEAHGDISILVNNAANDQRHSLEEYDVADWEKSLNINLRPHYFTAQTVAPAMKRMGEGAIINFSSASYLMGNAGFSSYVAAKAGITGLTRALARELGAHNIRVNALVPGWVLTQKQLDKWATEEGLKEHLEKQCLKEHLVEQDIVDATLFLASKTSRMMTSQALVVDGGVVMTG